MATPPAEQPPATGESSGKKPEASSTTYPAMITTAIAALEDRNGSSTRAIGKFMEEHFSGLPANHWPLLSDHLNQMKSTGELSTYDNGYYRLPSADSPPPPTTGGVEEDAPATSGVKRGRGRPPKRTPQGGSPAVLSGVKRGRGRPPKSPTVGTPSSGGSTPKTPGRGRGRPRKDAGDASASGPEGGSSSGKPRGRPPKRQKLSDSGSGEPQGRPGKELATAASEQEGQEVQDLRDRLEYVQTRIKTAAALVKPHLTDETALQAIDELVKLTTDAAADDDDAE